VHWKYLNETFVYTVTDKNGEIVAEMPDPVKLKLENLRKSTDPQLQAHTAVHEAGHAVLAALTLRIIPSVVVSKTASESEGFCLVNFPTGPMTKKTLRLDIMLTLGGYLAEKMIFGDEFTSSGVYQDIEQATELANKAVRKYAMGSDPIRLSIETTDTDAFYEWEKYSNESLKLIRECEEEATKILERNKLLLLKIAEYLTQNSRMEEPLIAEFVKKYSCEEWVTVDGFVTKDKYYRFNSILQSQLKQAETDEGDSIIGSLLSESKVN
jgi:cell division protease FtsH